MLALSRSGDDFTPTRRAAGFYPTAYDGNDVNGTHRAPTAFIAIRIYLCQAAASQPALLLTPAPTCKVSVVTQSIAADFTSLGSFGDDFTWGFNIVNETDRSWKDPNDVAAELIDTKKLGDKYFVEYSVKLPGVYDRRLYSIAAIGNIPDKYNLLYTLSATVPTAMMDEYSDTVLEIIKSFKCTHPGVLVPV